MEDKRVADYFVVAGLPSDNPDPLDEFSRDGNSPKTTQSLVPITDISIIIQNQGEMVPKEYHCIETTPFGFPADLNHGSIRSPNIYLCYRRGKDKPPLVDVGVLYDGKERVMADSEVVLTTPYGRSANVNNSGSRTFITYRRAPDNAPCNQLVVTDICIILANKGEHPPRAFCLIEKNLNKGVLGSDVFLCYKKSMNRPDILSYKPAMLGRFPLEDYVNFPMPQSVSLFCLPMGSTIECWPKNAQQPKPVFSTFVLTSDTAEKVYGAAVTFYEQYPENKLSDSMKVLLVYTNTEHKKAKALFTNKSICILSRWPFFDTFEKFLRYLHRMSISGPHRVPLERIISHFMLEVPFPSPQRPRILIQLADCTISLAQPEDTPLPLTGASFVQLLRNLGADNCLKVLLYALAEQKILFHSLRPDVLTSVAEAVVMLIFPFHWQCPYIPLCPLGLSDVLCAPLPYIVGVDSRYFDLFDPPHDVTCVDLDTNSIFLSEEKRGLNVKLLPKRPTRILKNSLESLYEKLGTLRTLPSSKTLPSTMSALIDYDFKVKKREHQLELEIQEAFLKFMASILKGYRTYLRPITTAPTIGTTDTNSLFDLNGFQRSRDKTHNRFFSLVTKTQMFIRFIEERSFVSDKDVSLAFFDECTEKIYTYDGAECRFLEVDESHTSDRTVFIAPPEPLGLPPGLEYKYKQFGTLKPQLFHKHPSKNLLSVFAQSSPTPSSPLARRTKQEIKTAQKMARKQSENSVTWAKCLSGYCFSLWFIHLPSYVKLSPSKSSALRMAFNVLVYMQKNKLSPPDEVCYRVLMLLCGLYSQPTLAVKVLFEMKQHGIQPNAITYGYYNKAVLESKWPSTDAGSTLMWNRLRNVIIGVAQFRQGVKRKTRRSISLCSDMDYDLISGTSNECSNPDEFSFVKIRNPTEFVSDLVHLVDHQNDLGVHKEASNCSINQDEGLKMSSSAASSDSVMEEERDFTAPSNKDHRIAKESCSSRFLKFQEIDFSASDAFRCRVGSIVKCSATSIGSFAQLQDVTVDSAAGILMTSQASLLEDCMLNVSCDSEFRRRHRSAGDFKCSGKHSYRLRHCTGPVSEDLVESGSHSPFLRSHSFGCDAQIISKIREEKIKTPDCDVAFEKMNSSVKWNGPSEKNKEDKDQKSNSNSFGLSRCDEEPEVELDIISCGNLNESVSCLHNSSPVDVDVDIEVESTNSAEQNSEQSDASSDTFAAAAAADVSTGTLIPTDTEESCPVKTFSVTSNGGILQGIRDKDFLSSFSPIKEAWLNWDLNKIPRLASNISYSLGLNSSGDSKNPPSKGKKVTRSSTFHNGSNNATRRSKSKVDCLVDLDVNDSGNKSLSRSSTLPVPPRSKSVSHKLPGMQSSSRSAFPSSSSSFGISRLTSRHSEILIDGFKSAVSSVSTKISEIRTSLSVSSTPIKGNYSSSSASLDTEKLPLYGSEERCNLSREGHRSSVDYLSGSSHSDDAFNGTDYFTSDALQKNNEQHLSIPHCGSAPAFSSQVFDLLEKHSDIHSDHLNIPKTAMEIRMTTCSRCFTCSSLLYDEEIMEGWSADDSNLNTQCTFCKAKLVPLLTVTIRDCRWVGSVESLITPAYSTESLRSVPICSIPLSFDGNSIHNHPRLLLGDRSSTQNSSIDSGNEGFILLEDSPENDESCFSSNNAKNKRYHQTLPPPPNYLRKSIDGGDGGDVHGGDPVSSYSSRNSTCSLLEDDLCGSMLLFSSNAAKGGPQQSSSTSSSIGGDVRKSINSAFLHTTIDPITVPYLSPLVLRKEVENVLEHEGDNCLTKPHFVDQHPIIYWNLVWFFKRIGVPSHLPGLILQADTVNKDKQIPDIWLKGDSKNVVVHCLWDNVKLHEDMGEPLYMQWRQQGNGGEQSSLVHALVTEERKASKSVMRQVLAKLQCNDLQSPICMLINERRKSTRKHHHSIYREILFLSFVAIGRKNIDNMSFDVKYRKAYDNLSIKQLNQMQVNDKPVCDGAVFCRSYFKDLELKLP